MEKKKGLSILKIFVTVICILLIIISVITNVAFSNGKVPKILGRHIYIVSKQDNMSSFVSEGSALIAKDAKNESITNGRIVLCYPADDPSNLRVREIINADPLANKYGTKDDRHIDKGGDDGQGTITKDKIVAVCSGYPESKDLGAFIRFATALKGIILLLILPCVVLVIFLIAKIASSTTISTRTKTTISTNTTKKPRTLLRRIPT